MRRAEERLTHASDMNRPTQQIRISVGASCRRIAWDLEGSAFKLWGLSQFVVSERKSKTFCQDKDLDRGQKYPQENCPKVPTYDLRPV